MKPVDLSVVEYYLDQIVGADVATKVFRDGWVQYIFEWESGTQVGFGVTDKNIGDAIEVACSIEGCRKRGTWNEIN